MKKILIVLAAAVAFVSCNETDKTAETATSSNTAPSTDTAAPIANAPSTVAAAPAEPVVDSATLTTIQWLDGADKDFGKMKEGENLDVSFRFKNTGSKPLVISRVWAQCGCTVPETPQKPYAPGETGVIKASFNSTGKPGVNSKEVYMSANTNPGMSTLKFHVDVKPKSK
jgi:hypothetical protein